MRWSGYVSVTLDANGNGLATISGPRFGFRVRLDGGTVTSMAAGGPTLTLYNSIQSSGRVILTMQTGVINNISGDGRTELVDNEFVIVELLSGSKSGIVTVSLTGELEQR